VSPWRRLVPSALCLGMAVVPLLALRSGSTGAGTTVSIAGGDAPAGRQVADRAGRSAARRSFDVAMDSAATDGSLSVTPAVLASAPAPVAGAAIAAAAPARRVGARAAAVTAAAPRVAAAPKPAPPRKPAPPARPRPSETGSASWYGAPAGTCAHPWLAIGTVITVTDLANGRSTTCRVADRGPFAGGRVIDLSEATFAQLASPSSGVIDVRLTW